MRYHMDLGFAFCSRYLLFQATDDGVRERSSVVFRSGSPNMGSVIESVRPQKAGEWEDKSKQTIDIEVVPQDT